MMRRRRRGVRGQGTYVPPGGDGTGGGEDPLLDAPMIRVPTPAIYGPFPVFTFFGPDSQERGDVYHLLRSQDDFANFEEATAAVVGVDGDPGFEDDEEIEWDIVSAFPEGEWQVRLYYTQGDKISRPSPDYTITIDATLPVISGLAGVANAALGGTISFTLSEAATTKGIVTTNATPPTATQIAAGQDAAGSALTVDHTFTKVSAAAGGAVETIPDAALDAAETYYVHSYAVDLAGNVGAVTTSASFDTAAPTETLSAPTGVTTGTTTATVGATTTGTTGTMFGVLGHSEEQPTGAQIEAGQGTTGAARPNGSLVIGSSGVKTFGITGGTSGRQYWPHLVHKTAAGYSNIVTADPITLTASASPIDPTYIAAGDGGDQDFTATTTTVDLAELTLGSEQANRRVSLVIGTNGGTAHGHTSLTLYPTSADRTALTNGIVADLVDKVGATADTTGNSTTFLSHWVADVPTGASVFPRLICNDAAPARGNMQAWEHSCQLSGTPLRKSSGTAGAGVSGTIDVPSSGHLIMAGLWTNSGDPPTTIATLTGITTENYDGHVSSALYAAGGLYNNDGSADTAKAVGMTVFEIADGVTQTGGNKRFIAAAYAAAA